MKRTLLFLAGCLAPATLATTLTTDAASQSAVVRSTPAAEAAAPARGQDDVGTLRRAARILRANGHGAESKRLLEIANGMKAQSQDKLARKKAAQKKQAQRKEAQKKKQAEAKKRSKAKTQQKAKVAQKVEAKAKKILKGNFKDKAHRVKALELVAECYKRSGDKANAKAMAWFASIGKAQAEGTEMPMDSIPEAAMAGDGNVQERLTQIIKEGGAAQKKLGNRASAKVHATLADFYVRRSRGELDAVAIEVDPSESTPAKHYDLSYIEGRLPALQIAQRAYSLDVPVDSDIRKDGAKAMDWMVALARLRVEGEGVEVPEAPSPVNMESLIDRIRMAAELHAKAGNTDDAKRCFDLAEFYKLREAGVAVDNSAANRRLNAIGYAGTEESAEDAEANALRRALEERKVELERRIAEVRQRLEAAKAELEAIRRSNRASGNRRSGNRR